MAENKNYSNDACEYNVLDGPYLRTENDPINVVHKRYWILLVVGAILIGLISFYSPVPMASALHCRNDETNFVYMEVSSPLSSASELDRAAFIPLSGDALNILITQKTAHMMQQEAAYSASSAIIVLPAEDTNYGLYTSETGSYVFAIDADMFRYFIKDNASFYPAFRDALH